MKTSFAYTALAAVLAASASAQNASTVVNLGYAQYRGIGNASLGITGYYGIHYAQSPVGELRFAAPQDIEKKNNYSATTVMDATQRGPQCIQGNPQWQMTTADPLPSLQPGSEDCLLLDILVPSSPKSSTLPVMVQIHGGGYAAGNSESYPGYALVNQSMGGIIYVSIQYRLNAFGWLASQEVRENGSPNAGLLDQRSALDWIQRNIRAFGGDPAQVTIIGGSAGGGSVMNQMILYGGEASPPFRAVICEYPWWQPYHNNTVLEAQYQEVLNAANCTDIQCLRSLSSDEVNMASQAAQTAGYLHNPEYYGYGDFYYGPAVDGEIVRDLPSNEFKQGHFTKVPLLVDHDQYEGYVFSNTSETTMVEETMDLQGLFPYAKQSFFSRLYQLYPSANFNSTLFQRQQIYGDFIISCPTYYMASASADWGQPTWKMIFDAGSELHGATTTFLFVTNETQINNMTLSYIMKDYFLSFATNLDPNAVSYSGTTKPYWPQYLGLTSSSGGGSNSTNGTSSAGGGNGGAGNFTIMDVNYTMIGVTPDQDASTQCDFFHGQSYVVRN